MVILWDGVDFGWTTDGGFGGGGGVGGGPLCASEPWLRQLQCQIARRECQVGKVDTSCREYSRCCGGDAGTP